MSPELARRVLAARRLDTSEAEPTFVIERAVAGYLRLSGSAHALLRRRAAGASPAEIAAELTEAGQQVTTSDVAAACTKLERQCQDLDGAPRVDHAFLVRAELLSAPRVQAAARRLTWLVSWPAVCAIAVLIGWFVPAVAARSSIQHASHLDFWIGYGLAIAGLLMHELGHAAACARFGAAPSGIGFTVYLIFPAFYSDVTAAWTLRRWQRVVVDLGGMYFQLVAMVALAVAHAWTGWPPLAIACAISLGVIVFNLNPFLRFDGYWIIADALGVTNLGRQVGRIVRWGWSRVRRRPGPALPWSPATTAMVAIYAVASSIFLGGFLLWIGPALIRGVATLPDHAAALIAADGAGAAVVAALGLARGLLLVIIGVVALRRIVGGLIARLRR